GADERPVENPVDGRTGRDHEKSCGQCKVKHETVEGSGRVGPQGLKTPGKVAGKNDAENGKNDIYERVHGELPENILPTPYIADLGNAIWLSAPTPVLSCPLGSDADISSAIRRVCLPWSHQNCAFL